MWIEKINLKHYRNYTAIESEFSQSLNVFVGQNAQGKTNFLEAIYFLSLTRSHRTRSDKELIQFGQKELNVSGLLNRVNGKIPLEINLSNKGRTTKINYLKQPKLSDYIGTMTVVLFAPEDLQLIKGSPSLRRKFIDIDLGQIKPIYLSDLSNYNHVLKQRNAYLKSEKKVDTDFLFVLDEQLVDYGSKVIEHRLDFIQNLLKISIFEYKKGAIMLTKRKIFTLLLSFSMIFTITSCTKKEEKAKLTVETNKVDNNKVNQYSEKHVEEVDYKEFSDVELGREKAKKIIKCFSEGDKETLKSMFTEKIRKRKEMDTEIDKAMEFFEGKVINDDWISFRDGERTVPEKLDISTTLDPYVYYIKTDKGKTYAIYGVTIIVNEKDIDDVGIIGLIIFESDDKEWPSFENAPKVIIGTPEF